MIGKVISSLAAFSGLNSTGQNGNRDFPLTIDTIDECKSETCRFLVEQSVLRETLTQPTLFSSYSRTAFNGLLQQGSIQPQPGLQTPLFDAVFSSGPKTQTSTIPTDNTALFQGGKEFFYYGAPKPQVYYNVPEKLWQAVVMTPGIEKAVEAFEGIPALFELPRWEVETGYGMEPRFNRIEINESMLLSYDYPKVLTYATDILERDNPGAGAITILKTLSQNIQKILTLPLSTATRPSEAYYASRILVLFGEEELYKAFEKSIKSYVQWVKNTMSEAEQITAFHVPKSFEAEYRKQVKAGGNETDLSRMLEKQIQERNSNYNYPRQHDASIKKIVATNAVDPTTSTTKNDTSVHPAETTAPSTAEEKSTEVKEAEKPLTSRDKLQFYGKC